MPEWISSDILAVCILAAIAFCGPVLLGFLLSLGFRYLGQGDLVRKNRIYRLISNSINVAAFIVGAISCLGTLGVDTTALVAGLGLTSLALGFALKDAVSNFIAGVMIILYSPFDLGDNLEVSGAKGPVIDMDLRYVTIETDKEHVLIPNNSFLNSVVKRAKPAEKEAEAA